MAKQNETTTKFRVDITELKKAMQEAKRQVSIANSEFKAVSSSMDNWAKSSEGLKAKLKQLDTNLNSQKTILSNLERQYELTVQEMGEGSAAADRLKVAINNQKATINQTERQISTFTTELNRAEQAEEIAARTGRDATEVFDELGDEAKNAGKEAEKSSDGFTVMKGALASLVADGIKTAITALKDFTKAAAQTGMDFEASMSEVAAISGATGDQLELLEKTAREYGATTVFSASEAAQALKYMALAGWNAETATSALGGVLDLAASAGMDLAQASDMVTDYLSAFGLEAKQSTYFADMLAYAQSNSNTSAEQLGEAYKNTAANMKAAGQDVETTTALLAMMANQGFKGSEAGTALTAMMRDLTAKMKDGKIMIGETSVTVQDANGNYRDLTEILKDVEKATQGMGDAERATALATTFTADSTKGLNLLLNAGVDEAASFEESLRKAGGTAAKMGEIMNDNAAGDVKALQSALEGVKIELYKELQPQIRDFIKYLTKDGIKILKNITSSVGNLAKKAIPYVKTALKALAKVVKFAVDHFEGLVAVILTGVTVFKALKAAMAISATITAFKAAVAATTGTVGLATKAQALWNAAMSANPIGAVVTAVATLAVGIGALVVALGNASKSTDVLNSSQRATVNSAKEAADAYRDNKQAASEMATAELTNIDYANKLWNELQGLASASGEVKEKDKARAEFILGELNNALGTEYTMTGNIIDNYAAMREEIAKVIEAKKAQILMEQYEESYRQAIQNVAEAERARAIQAQELAIQQAKYDEADIAAKKARAYLDEQLANAKSEADLRALAGTAKRVDELEKAAAKEKNALDDVKSKYDDSASSLKRYYDDITSYETASTLIMEGETEKAITYLNKLNQGRETAASVADKSAEEQKKILEAQVIDTEVQLRLMVAEYNDAYEDMTEAQREQARLRIKDAEEAAESAKEEFAKVGGNITLGIVSGAEGEKWTLTSSMSSLITSAVEAAKKAAGIKSPSRLFKREVGKFLGLGVAAGIDDSTKDVVKSVKSQVLDIKDAYNTAANRLSVGAGVGAGIANTGSTATTYNFYQTNNSPKALSRLEIYRQSKNLLGYAGGV